jgi:hypothetical protein
MGEDARLVYASRAKGEGARPIVVVLEGKVQARTSAAYQCSVLPAFTFSKHGMLARLSSFSQPMRMSPLSSRTSMHQVPAMA